LTRKPKIVVTGGYDVAGEKEIGYGLMLSPVWKRMVRYILRRAKAIISVSHSNKNELETYLGINHSKVVYNCADGNKFKPSGKKDERLVLTVGTVKIETWMRKGLQKFIELAKIMPDFKFVVVGKIHDDIKCEIKIFEIEVPNLTFTGYVSDEKLVEWYQKAKVYCQFSMHEGFGVSLAEAMLSECVPVVTNRRSLPEVVGDEGIIVDYNNLEQMKNAVIRASKMDGKSARERILKLFPPERRQKELIEVIEVI